MNIWLVKLEESLPIDVDYRPYRMGMLVDALLQRGHSVVRWASDRVHLTGKVRYGKDMTVFYKSNQTFEILNSGIKYNKPISPLRLLDNYFLASKFKKAAQNRKKPDLIICAMPTPELAMVSSQLGKLFDVPVILDARDYWPDIFEKEMTGLMKFFSWPIVYLMKRNLMYAAKNATSLVGITEFYRDHLLNYAQKPCNDLTDSVFPLGYSADLNQLPIGIEEQASMYWEVFLGKDWLQKKRKIIYFAGRLNSTVFKALGPVITLVKKAEQTWPDYVFVFCGSGQYEMHIKSAFNGMGNVIMPGEVSAINLSYLRAKSYLALQPIENRVDYLNSLSNKFFEYISSGLPIITSLKGITESLINENQIGFVYYDEVYLIECLEKLYANEDLRNAMSSRSRVLFRSEYSADIVYLNFAKHCEKIVSYYKNNYA